MRTWMKIPVLHGDRVTQADLRGIKEFQKMAMGVGRDMKKEMRGVAKGLMKPVQQEAVSRATLPLQKQVAKSIQPELFKGLPAIRAGGTKRLSLSNGRGGKHEVWAGEVFAGAEFGSNQNKYSGRRSRRTGQIVRRNKTGSQKQFPPRTARLGRGNEGYFFYPAIRAKLNQSTILKEYFKMMDGIWRNNRA